jgi:hypothetical protein
MSASIMFGMSALIMGTNGDVIAADSLKMSSLLRMGTSILINVRISTYYTSYGGCFNCVFNTLRAAAVQQPEQKLEPATLVRYHTSPHLFYI